MAKSNKSGGFLSGFFSKAFTATAIGAIAYGVYTYYPDLWQKFFGDTKPDIELPTDPEPVKPKPTDPEPSDPTRDVRLANYLPSVTGTNQVVKHTYYTLSYANAYEQSEWVAYELTKTRVNKGIEERGNNFRPDASVKLGSATPDDYKSTGYDRGHLAPAKDMSFDATAMSESFFMSNMSPQEPGFNRGIWKELEEQVRDYAVQCDHVYVVTGPILPANIVKRVGKNKVAVPKSYYKVLLDMTGSSHKGIAFILPNEDSDKHLKEFVVTIDDVEKKTGLNFFPTLSKTDEAKLEAKSDITQWGVNDERAQKRIMEVKMRLAKGIKLSSEL